ncbi:MAG: hypothetical protein IT374_26255 [Polyangiaceae bacterium]|nr:hypothetical protein [Polyangiaceae bacterium]
MVFLADCPEPAPVVRLVPAPRRGNREHAALLRRVADHVEQSHFRIGAVGVAVAYDDGDTGTAWSGPALTSLLGAVEVLRLRIGREFE